MLQEYQANNAVDSLVRPIDPNDPEQNPSDLTVKCGSLDVKTHSHILCQDSSYFKVICKGGFLVNPQDTILKEVNLLTIVSRKSKHESLGSPQKKSS